MKSGTEFDPLAGKSILIVGDPGSRKTTLLLQFPTPYIFDADGNISGPVQHLKATDFYYDLAFRDDDGKDIPPPLRYGHLVKCLNAAAANPDIKTIGLDSMTSITDIIISECKRTEHRKDDQPMRLQDWGTFLYITKRLITQLKSTGKIIVATAHNRMEKDESDGRWKNFLAIPGQSATILAGLFTDVINPYCRVRTTANGKVHEFRIRTLPVSDNDHRGIKSTFSPSADVAYTPDFLTNLLAS